MTMLITATTEGQKTQIDSIAFFFEELKAISKKNEKVWNIDLYGPILLVDPKTRKFYANEPYSLGICKRNGDIFTGQLPEMLNIANTAVNWSGKRWAMIMLPLPNNKHDRVSLLAHESFHVVQPQLGFDFKNIDNNHLDQKDGRVYLRLELEALSKAIQSKSSAKVAYYINHALIFRKYRHILFPGSANTENQLEIFEGLAEYTGLVYANRNKKQTKIHFNHSIRDFFNNPTFVRSFAYQTIPAYGYFLFLNNKKWNHEVSQNTDLTQYFIKQFKVKIPTDIENTVHNISSLYNGEAIMAEEIAREEKIKAFIAECKSKFVENFHLEIYFEQMNVQYDPRNIAPIEDKGTYYPNMRITDKWGILTVTNGALMSPDWDKISLTIPTKTEEDTITGDGWNLVLSKDYKIINDPKKNMYKIIKK